MPYRIEIKKDPDYILVDQFGEVNLDEVDEIRIRVFELVAARGLSKVLVDVCKVTNDLSVTDSFNITLDHLKFKTPFQKPRACLISRPDQYENTKFIETVAVNRGLPIKAFTDPEEGLKWLMMDVTGKEEKPGAPDETD